jgi:hypothetical protein
MAERISESGPIQRPPHLSAGARRRYKRTLSLDADHPERLLLLEFYHFWATWGDAVYYLEESTETWTPSKKLARRLAKNNGGGKEHALDFQDPYFLFFNVMRLFDAWNGHGEDPVDELEARWREEAEILLDIPAEFLPWARRRRYHVLCAIGSEMAKLLHMLAFRLEME